MKPWLRYSLTGLFAVLFLVGAILMRHSEKAAREQIVCTGIDVRLRGKALLLGAGDVENHIACNYGEFLGRPLHGLDLARIEKILSLHQMVAGCEAWTTDDGILHVSVRRRTPILRFEGENPEDGFHCDAQGVIFPLVEGWTADVPVVKGRIKDALDPERLALVIRVVEQLSNDRTWHGRISEYVCLDGGKFGFRTGGTLVDLGDISSMQGKLEAVGRYFEKVAPVREYSYVCVDYKGMIICRNSI